MITLKKYLEYKLSPGAHKEEIVEYNKALIKKYPFLLPRDQGTCKVNKNYTYQHTELDKLPYGWRISFGEDMCKALLAELKKCDYLKDYQIIDIKNNNGLLCWSDYGFPSNSIVDVVIQQYRYASIGTCQYCGKPTKYCAPNKTNFLCEHCASERYANLEKEAHKLSSADVPRLVRHQSDGKVIEYPLPIDFKSIWK